MVVSLDRRRVSGARPPGEAGPEAPEPSRLPLEALLSGAEIVARARTGDEAAWACLYRSLAPLVRGYFAARRVRQPDDLTSEVFLEVARRICGFEGDGAAFRTWVFTIAHSRLVDDLRRCERRGEEASLDEAFGAMAPDDVESEVMGRLRREELLDLLDCLSPDQRDVVLLRVFGGLKVAEVAAVMHRTTTSVKVLHHRAVKALQRLLAPEGVTKRAPERLPD